MKNDVDVDALLPLVQERELLWFTKDPNYRNHRLSETAWNEICRQLYPSSDLQASDTVTKVKAKWTRVRDCFQKAQKRRQEKDGSSPQEYIHFEKMKFLLKNTQPYESSAPAPVDPDAKTVFNEILRTQPNNQENIFETNAAPTLSRNIHVKKSLFAQLKEIHLNGNVQPTVEGRVRNVIPSTHDNPAFPQDQVEDQQASPPKRFKTSPSTSEIQGEEAGNPNISSTSQNSFNVIGESVVTNTVKEEDILTAIVPATYPDVKLTEEQGDAIEHAILEQLQPMEDGNYPVFSGTHMERGALIINCSNDMTRQWLDKLVKEDFTPLGESVILEAISRDDMKPNKVSFKAPAKLSLVWTPEQIIDKLDKQNRSLKIDEWNIIDVLKETEAYIFVCSVDDECLDAIKSRLCMAHLGLWKVVLTIPDDADAVI